MRRLYAVNSKKSLLICCFLV